MKQSSLLLFKYWKTKYKDEYVKKMVVDDDDDGRTPEDAYTAVSPSEPHIMKTCPCNEYPLTPHFYLVKLGFIGVFIFFLIFALKHRLWVLVRTASLRRF